MFDWTATNKVIKVSNIILYQGDEIINPQNIPEIPDQKVNNVFAGKRFLSMGDSLTNASGDGLHWQNNVVQNLMMNDYITAGAVGLTLANVPNSNSIYSHIIAMTTADTSVGLISLWGGTNDWNSNIPLGDFDIQKVSSTRDNTTFYGGLFDCVEKILTLYPEIPFFLVGTTPRINDYDNNKDSNNTTNGNGLYLKDYVDAVKNVSDYYGIPFIDLYRDSGMNKYNINGAFMFEQTPSGQAQPRYFLHFSGKGQQLVGKLISGFINKTWYSL